MRLLLDTHYVFALAGSTATLSKPEMDFLARHASPLVVSAVSIWEIRLKWLALHPSGVPKGPLSPLDVLYALRLDPVVDFLDLKLDHAATVLEQPLLHRDPFDELLLTQAQFEGLRLLTRDRKLVDHPLATRVT